MSKKPMGPGPVHRIPWPGPVHMIPWPGPVHRIEGLPSEWIGPLWEELSREQRKVVLDHLITWQIKMDEFAIENLKAQVDTLKKLKAMNKENV